MINIGDLLDGRFAPLESTGQNSGMVVHDVPRPSCLGASDPEVVPVTVEELIEELTCLAPDAEVLAEVKDRGCSGLHAIAEGGGAGAWHHREPSARAGLE